jgi:hypothetical protein
MRLLLKRAGSVHAEATPFDAGIPGGGYKVEHGTAGNVALLSSQRLAIRPPSYIRSRCDSRLRRTDFRMRGGVVSHPSAKSAEGWGTWLGLAAPPSPSEESKDGAEVHFAGSIGMYSLRKRSVTFGKRF